MSTVNNNNIVIGTVNGLGFQQISNVHVNNSTHPVNQGDLVYLSSGLAVSLDSDSHAATLIGVALGPSAVSSSLDNSSAPAVKSINVGFGCIANLKTTASETYTDGTLVYAGADAQTITTVSGSNAVGVIKLPSDVSSVTGAAGVTVGVLVYCRSFVAYHN